MMIRTEHSSESRQVIERLFPHRVRLSMRMWENWEGNGGVAVVAWCRQEFQGDDAFQVVKRNEIPERGIIDPDGYWCYGFQAFYFKNQYDALHFKMRWGGC